MHNICKTVICLILSLTIVSAPAHAQLHQLQSGLSYLTSSLKADGTWGGTNLSVETTTATVSALETLKLLNRTADASYNAGISWLQAQSLQSVDHIAARIQLLGLTDVDALMPAVDSTKGGWGGFVGYETNNLDTILALQALNKANYQTPSVIYPSLAYITGSQNPDGGWGFKQGDDSSVYMTAVISTVLQQFPQMATIATAIKKATSFLVAHQNIDGGIGRPTSTVYETALAYTALVAVSTDATALGGAVNYLAATQSADGSWNNDPYSTSLALKALHFSEQKPPPPPPPATGGEITGTVIDASTTQQLNGVVVVLESNPLVNTTTDSSGNFTLSDVPTGDQVLNFSMTDYASHTISASVADREVVGLGNIPLVSSYSTGTIAGTIQDSEGQPLPAVSISVTGAWSGSAVTGDDGGYIFTYVTPGEVTISAAKADYRTVVDSGTVFARTTLSFSPRLGTAPPRVATGSLVGRVVDDSLGVPIDHLPGEEGVTVRISGGVSVEPDPDNGGYFNIQGLAPNTYQVTVGMPGFTSRTFRVLISPGVTTDLGTIRLGMSFAMTLTGRITDESTGTPISGAEVAVIGTGLAARTDFAGGYVIADINDPEISLNASATGYKAKSYTIGSAPWTQVMDITLSPLATTGSLTGAVVDTSSGEPLNGVALNLVGDPSVSAITDSAGRFTFDVLPRGARQIRLSLPGYAQLIMTTKVTAGAVGNVGEIVLSEDPAPAYIRGTAWDAIADTPFADVEMMAAGTASVQTFTAEDGTYTLSDMPPGAITLTATAGSVPGYHVSRFTGKLEQGGVLIFNPALSTTPPPGSLKGTVTDFSNNYPIHGATITLSPAPAGVDHVFTDASGAFSASGIAAGTYTASIYAPGYTGQKVTVDIAPEHLGETNIAVALRRYFTSTRITGEITDASDGSPIAGAEISIADTDKSTITDAEGNYSLSGITTLSVTVQASAAGYDGRAFSFRANAYGEYNASLALSPAGTSTTTIFGTIREEGTNLPIAGAEVAIVGTDRSALTDSDGKYSLRGVTAMTMDLKASALGYNSRHSPLAFDVLGDYEAPFELTKSRLSTVFINSLSTDKPTYEANAPVTVLAEIENGGDSAAEISLEAEIVDQHGIVLGLVSLPENPITLDAQALRSISLQWNSQLNPPGPHQVVLHLIDHARGGLLAEEREELAIAPTAGIDELIPLISPKFVTNGATETIGLSAYLVNRSNVDVSLSARYEIKDPEGILVAGGAVDFPLAASEAFTTLPLSDFSQTFVKSGQYPVTVEVFSGDALLAQVADAIYVAPSIRIEPARTLSPTSVIPDGDKDIRILIRLKGMEEL